MPEDKSATERVRDLKEEVGLERPPRETPHRPGDATTEAVAHPRPLEDGAKPQEFQHT